MNRVRTNPLAFEELESIQLETTEFEGKRYYIDLNGQKYPSVTTVTGLHSREQIKLWRQRVGEEEANRITKAATTRGTKFHEKVEHYLRKDVPYVEFDNLIEEAMFKGVQPILDEIAPLALEAPLYSDMLRMAGRVDCIGLFDDALQIIDFKTSSKWKKEEYAKGYFLQMTAYAIMVEELTGHPIEECTAIVALPDGNCQLFSCDPVDYVDELQQLRRQYYNLYGV
jgi:genome maintenance exonuclease 1